ncbi:MAG: hypothetical protein AAGN66_26825 [Acidobacteriota bacterium]
MNMFRYAATAFATLILLATGAHASEVGYDLTLGEIHTQVSYSYNITWDAEYAALPGQASQLVVDGAEIFGAIDPSPFTDEEYGYLASVLQSAGSKAVLLEDGEGAPKVYVPIPSHSEPALSIPDSFQNRAGVWVRAGWTNDPNCHHELVIQGNRGEAPGCNCYQMVRECCGTCPGPNMCFPCAGAFAEREHLEDLYGPDLRWSIERPFAEIEPGLRLEVEATVDY